MLWTIIALIILMFFLGLAAWFIFLWAAKSGQFDDIERPKHRMMDDVDRADHRSKEQL